MSDLLKMVKGTSTMLDDMVNWTKLQIKGDGAHFELNSLSDWLDKTINNLNEIAKTKGVRLKTSYDPSQKLYCDSILMTVVIRNII
ncbi:MAG: HAMP domain-containing histidine kinase, partial [Phaeodactylibacter sp.]|nr:HAMP domain-containing histidine kinase [Phaeodactylibacter sp.]